nr:MAG TPA: hypothetical protein [Caudoviricetes sp.]
MKTIKRAVNCISTWQKWMVQINFCAIYHFITNKNKKMKGLRMHFQACVLFAPVVMLFCGTFLCVLFGLLYCSIIVFWWSSTKYGRKFLRSYYHEILRLENML